MIGRIVWSKFKDPHNVVKLKLIKVDCTGFPVDKEFNQYENRADTFEKYDVGTIITLHDFLNDPDYYTKLYTIVSNSEDYVINV